MEQKYIDELAKLGFTCNVEKVKTVLETRAYHNTYSNVTDCSYAVLNIPTCFDAVLDEKIKTALFKALATCYQNSVEKNHFSYLSDPPHGEGNRIQFEFSGALTEKQLIEKALALLQLTLNSICDEFKNVSPSDPDSEDLKKRLNSMGACVKALQIFIQAGSTSHEYHTEDYDPLG